MRGRQPAEPLAKLGVRPHQPHSATRRRDLRPDDLQPQPAAVIVENPRDPAQAVDLPGRRLLCQPRAVGFRQPVDILHGVGLEPHPSPRPGEAQSFGDRGVGGESLEVVFERLAIVLPVHGQNPGPAPQVEIVHPTAKAVNVRARLDEIANHEVDALETRARRDLDRLFSRKIEADGPALQQAYTLRIPPGSIQRVVAPSMVLASNRRRLDRFLKDEPQTALFDDIR